MKNVLKKAALIAAAAGILLTGIPGAEAAEKQGHTMAEAWAGKTSYKFQNTNLQKSQLKEYNYEFMYPSNMWKKGYKGQNVKVAVLDTGIDIHHKDLKVYGGVSYVPGHKSYDDDEGHGTHVAGLIAAKDNKYGVVGIAPESRLYSVKVLDKNGEGEMAWITKGIEWSIKNKMNVINMSLGLTPDEIGKPGFKELQATIKKAYKAGIVMVAASGNEEAKEVAYPAKWNEVISVGALDADKKIASFSNTGKDLDLTAIGFLISTYPLDKKSEIGEKGFEWMFGTSMAAPNVAGMAALYKSQYPKATVSTIKSTITTNSKWRYDLGKKGFDPIYGNGMSSLKYFK